MQRKGNGEGRGCENKLQAGYGIYASSSDC